MTSIVKHPQFILAVERAYLTDVLKCQQGFNDISWGAFIAGIDSYLVVKQRNALEKDPRYMQILPYCVITSEQEPDQVFVYQRTKMVGEERLGGNHSIGGGGHIDFDDIEMTNHGKNNPPNIIDFESTVFQALRREFSEEFLIDYAPHPSGAIVKGIPLLDMDAMKFQGVITDFRRDVEEVHVALVFHYVLKTFKEVVITCREKELVTVGARSVMRESTQNARAVLQHWPLMEPWSKILIERGLGKQPAMLEPTSRPTAPAKPYSPASDRRLMEPLMLSTPIQGLSMSESRGSMDGFPGLSVSDLFPSPTVTEPANQLNLTMTVSVPADAHPIMLQAPVVDPGQIVRSGYLKVAEPEEGSKPFSLKLNEE